jgi:GNAT superfamily N-acetyltransferase
MKWPSIEALGVLAPLPSGYAFAPICSRDLAPLIASIKDWYPQISTGTNSCYLREDFYRDRVCLDGQDDKGIHATRILYGEELVGFWSFEREIDAMAIYGRLLVVAPDHRGTGLAAHAIAGTEGIGRAMGAAFMYAFATLQHPYAQRALERAGYRLLGFFPGRDREEVMPGVVKRVYQAVYAKLLVPPEMVQWPDKEKLTPRAKALFDLLFA